jgi:hypothetical protein
MGGVQVKRRGGGEREDDAAPDHGSQVPLGAGPFRDAATSRHAEKFKPAPPLAFARTCPRECISSWRTGNRDAPRAEWQRSALLTILLCEFISSVCDRGFGPSVKTDDQVMLTAWRDRFELRRATASRSSGGGIFRPVKRLEISSEASGH